MSTACTSEEIAAKLGITKNMLASFIGVRENTLHTKIRKLSILNDFIDLLGEFGVTGSMVLNILNDAMGPDGESLLGLLLRDK